MRKNLFASLAAAVAGTLLAVGGVLAQAPSAMPQQMHIPRGATVIQGHPTPAMIQQANHRGRAVHSGQPCCTPAPVVHHAPACEKVCVPVPDKKKITKNVYDVECKDYCLPKCPRMNFSLFSRHRGCDSDCGGCQQAQCQNCQDCERHVRTKRVLIKKKIDCGEECITKCEVQVRPVCAAPCAAPCASHGAPIVIQHGRPGEPIPPPAGKVPPMPPAGGIGQPMPK